MPPLRAAFERLWRQVMLGATPDLTNPATSHPLKRLPEDEEHAFVAGFLLSLDSKLLRWLLRSLDKQFVTSMDNMTAAGVGVLRELLLSLPRDQRPECFFTSLLEGEGVGAAPRAEGASETGETSSRMFASAQALSGESLHLKAEVESFLDRVQAA